MSKKYKVIILVLLILLLVVGGYYFWKIKYSKLSSSEEILPTVSTSPLGNKPDINPVDKVNPFTNIKTNPFE